MIRDVFLAGFLLLASSCSSSTQNPELLPATAKKWTLSSSNPMLARGQSQFGMDPRLIWNDPSILKEGTQYTLWVSAGLSAQGARIYRLVSSDGVHWSMTHGGLPVLEAGAAPSDFDCFGVETPAVLKVGSVFHMYYSAYKKGDVACSTQSIFVTLGHATSPDGITWTKQGELTSLTGVVGNSSGNPWGWLARAEPAAVYFNGRFYLYFADVRCRTPSCAGTPAAERGISLAISTDGHQFTQSGSTPILLQSSFYPASQGWEGYSTPWALQRNGGLDLFVDVAKTVNGHFVQTALAHFTSSDGQTFSSLQNDIVVAGAQPWSNVSVRAPTVIEENGVLKMWFAGDNNDQLIPADAVISGIGVAEYR